MSPYVLRALLSNSCHPLGIPKRAHVVVFLYTFGVAAVCGWMEVVGSRQESSSNRVLLVPTKGVGGDRSVCLCACVRVFVRVRANADIQSAVLVRTLIMRTVRVLEAGSCLPLSRASALSPCPLSNISIQITTRSGIPES